MLNTTDQIRLLRSAFYTGTNGTEILAEFGGTVILDTGLVLTYDDHGFVYSCPVGQRIFWSAPDRGSGFGPDLIPFPWVTYIPGVTGSPALVTVTGSADIAANLLGGTQTLTVDLAPVHGGQGRVLSGTVYTPIADTRGTAAILARHSIDTGGVSVISATQVRVVIQSSPAAMAGSTVFVVAQQLQTV